MTTVSNVTLKCAADGESATEICAACDLPVCDACISRRDGEAVACRSCDYRDALTGTVRVLAARRDDAVRADAARDPRRGGRMRTRVAAAILLVASPLLAFHVAPGLVTSLEDPPPFAYGAADVSDAPGLADALSGLWRVRAAMDLHLERTKGVAPKSLAELSDAPASCPGCGDPWTFVTHPGGWELRCPHPRRHNRSAVFIDSRYGPPQVVADASPSEK